MDILSKIMRWRRIAVLMFALQVMILVTGIVAFTAFYTSHPMLFVLHKNNTEQLKFLEGIQTEVQELFLLSQKGVGGDFLKYRMDQFYRRIQDWPRGRNKFSSSPTKMSIDYYLELQNTLQQERQQLFEDMTNGVSHLKQLWQQMIGVAVLSFILGLLLPIFILRRGVKFVQQARLEVEKQISNWSIEWLKTYSSSQKEDAFRDPQFWIQMVFLTLEMVLGQNKHPAAYFIREFSSIFREEIKKDQQKFSKNPVGKAA